MTIRIRVRKKAQRRSYLQRYSANVVHIRQYPLREPELGKARTTDPVTGRKELHSMEPRFHTFALKARNQAAQQTWGGRIIIDEKGELRAISLDSTMRLPVVRQADGSLILMRTEGPQLIPRAEVFFKLWQGTRRQSITSYMSVVLDEGKWNTLRYFFGDNNHLLVEEKRLANIIRRSIIYRSRDLLLQAVNNDHIYWEETQKLVTSELPPR